MWWWGAALLVAGILLGLAAARFRRREPDPETPQVMPAPPVTAAEPSPTRLPPGKIPPAVRELVAHLPGTILLVREDGGVDYSSRSARELHLVKRGRVAFENIAECAARTLKSQEPQVCELAVHRPPLRRGALDLRVRGIPVTPEVALLLLEDLTEERRLAAVRRDFIANVSHELKTPVGAVSLLAEAIVAAREDPEAVEHFASRMTIETKRLTTLINDVIDLSQVQGDDPMSHAEVVEVDDLVTGALEFVSGAAEARSIRLVAAGAPGTEVYGDHDQLETAIRNVLTNAVAYSEPETSVAIAVRATDVLVEIDVKDQGIGIPEKELDRIFERFYRVDEARSRVTGGTGLGLSIVRNVCRNHGGDVLVWSVEGEGSTFTLQLPRYIADPYESDQEEVGNEAGPRTDEVTA